ncbi:hypothetical protein J6590_106671, partial [Homalodisca vitripennis]
MAPIIPKHANRCTFDQFFAAVTCWTFGHHTTEPYTIIGLMTLVYSQLEPGGGDSDRSRVT